MPGRGFTAVTRSGESGPLPAAARRQPHLPDALHYRHFDSGAVLVLVQIHLGYNGAFRVSDIAWGQPVERVHQHILGADVAAAEIGKPSANLHIGFAGMAFDQVADHSTARDGRSTVPVKVEPVVPVS